MNLRGLRTVPALALALASTACSYPPPPENPTVDVMVARTKLNPGTKIEEKHLKTIRIPLKDLPAGAPRKRSQVLGHTTKVRISEGELILLSEVK